MEVIINRVYLFNGGVVSRKSRFASISYDLAYELLIGTAYRQFKVAPYRVSENSFQEESIRPSKCYQPQIRKHCFRKLRPQKDVEVCSLTPPVWLGNVQLVPKEWVWFWYFKGQGVRISAFQRINEPVVQSQLRIALFYIILDQNLLEKNPSIVTCHWKIAY